MTRRYPRMCFLRVWMTTYNFKGFKHPKTPKKCAWLGIFQPNWQNYKIWYLRRGRSDRHQINFDRAIEPHSWLRGWSRIPKFKFKMANGRHIATFWNRYNSPMIGPIWMILRWSHPIMLPTCPPWCGCHGNGRCLAKAHWTFRSYGRLEAERVNQFW